MSLSLLLALSHSFYFKSVLSLPLSLTWPSLFPLLISWCIKQLTDAPVISTECVAVVVQMLHQITHSRDCCSPASYCCSYCTPVKKSWLWHSKWVSCYCEMLSLKTDSNCSCAQVNYCHGFCIPNSTMVLKKIICQLWHRVNKLLRRCLVVWVP